MSRMVAALLGVANIVPLAYLWFFLSVVTNRGKPGHERDYPLEWLFPMHIGVMTLVATLALIYIVVALQAKNRSLLNRLLWAVGIGWGNVFVFPVVWYLFVWRKQARQGANVSAL